MACEKQKKYTRDAVTFCSTHAMASSVIYCSTKPQKKKYINFVLYYNKVTCVHINNVQLATNKSTALICIIIQNNIEKSSSHGYR